MSEAPRSLSLDLPCVHEAVREGRRGAEELARDAGLPEDEVERLMLVVSELLANAVDHGGGGGAFTIADLEGDVRMQVRLELDTKGWTLEVEDQGGGRVDTTTKLLEGADADDLDDERGRGLFLVRELVSRVVVTQGERGLVLAARRELGRG